MILAGVLFAKQKTGRRIYRRPEVGQRSQGSSAYATWPSLFEARPRSAAVVRTRRRRVAFASICNSLTQSDYAKRAEMRGTQEWLSFYFKSPMTAEGLYAEHDLFIQLMKLKNTLRHQKGDALITHLGTEYYD